MRPVSNLADGDDAIGFDRQIARLRVRRRCRHRAFHAEEDVGVDWDRRGGGAFASRERTMTRKVIWREIMVRSVGTSLWGASTGCEWRCSIRRRGGSCSGCFLPSRRAAADVARRDIDAGDREELHSRFDEVAQKRPQGFEVGKRRAAAVGDGQVR